MLKLVSKERRKGFITSVHLSSRIHAGQQSGRLWGVVIAAFQFTDLCPERSTSGIS